MTRFILSIFVILLFSIQTHAEQKRVFGEYEVHYIGLTTSELSKDVTKIYGIPRSRSLGYLSISVLKTGVSKMPVAWDFEITGVMSTLIGQESELKFVRIQETNALYLYSTFRFDHSDMYRFKLKVKPEGSDKTLDVDFSQRFYTSD